eukprot:10455256-Lingulodinium_polyedra.AAC.1
MEYISSGSAKTPKNPQLPRNSKLSSFGTKSASSPRKKWKDTTVLKDVFVLLEGEEDPQQNIE